MQKKISKIIAAIALSFSSPASMGQSLSINVDGSVADNSAMLEIKSTTKGLLIPRMTLTEKLAITLPATGLLICQTDSAFGLYLNIGTPVIPDWKLVTTSANAWNITGNTGTNDTINFVGTIDNVPLSIRVNNQPSGRLDHLLFNSFLGYQSGIANNTGIYNTAMGHQALSSNTSGFVNTAIGYQALKNNTVGFINTAVGHQALLNNVSGVYNTAYGYQVLYNNAAGRDNTAVGNQALYSNTASANTALGNEALYTNSTGGNNVAAGYRALYFNNTGSNNIAYGLQALYNNTSGFDNVAVGGNALYAVSIGYRNTAVGSNALSNNTSFSNTAIGCHVLGASRGGSQNTAVGEHALYNSIAGSNATAIGFEAMYNANNTLFAHVNYNVAIGFEALRGSAAPAANTGNWNTVTGYQSLRVNASGDNNTGNGYKTLNANTTGMQNTAVGSLALVNNTTGNSNTALGYNTAAGSIWDNTTCLGTDATATASNQVRIGNVAVTSIGGFQDWSNLSDSRFKENIRENVPGLSFITLLRPVTYQVNRNKVNAYLGINSVCKDFDADIITSGFLAQEVEAAAKQAGYDFSGVDKPKNNADFYGLRYAEFVVPLVKAVQEQEVIIKDQGKRIVELEKLLKQLSK